MTGWFGSFEELKAKAEEMKTNVKEIGEGFFVDLNNVNYLEVMGFVSRNAWNGEQPLKVSFYAGNNLIEIEGYTIEPSYECYEPTASLTLNGEVLFGEDSRCIDAYKYERIDTGKFKSCDEAIEFLKKEIEGLEVSLVTEETLDEKVLAAEKAAENQNSNSKQSPVSEMVK